MVAGSTVAQHTEGKSGAAPDMGYVREAASALLPALAAFELPTFLHLMGHR